jgi:SAM-dependent methyltransferase
MRHLPKLTYRKRLLDLGCGSGAFLLRARSAGWDVVGVDPDVKAVGSSRKKGLDVRLGGVEIFDRSDEQFDFITLAHTIEHSHNPLEVLRSCYKLLKPGGSIWIDTPNIESLGYQLFGANWLHLDPPRHLVLFTFGSIIRCLHNAGFSMIKIQPYRPLFAGSFMPSVAIANGLKPFSKIKQYDRSQIVKKAERIAKSRAKFREFITVQALK